jgi:hypothetical protein
MNIGKNKTVKVANKQVHHFLACIPCAKLLITENAAKEIIVYFRIPKIYAKSNIISTL